MSALLQSGRSAKRSYGTVRADAIERGYLAEQGAIIVNANSCSHRDKRMGTEPTRIGRWNESDDTSLINDLMLAFHQTAGQGWKQSTNGGYMDAQPSLSGIDLPGATREYIQKNIVFAGVQVNNHTDNPTMFGRNKIALFTRGMRTLKNVMNSEEVRPGDLLYLRAPPIDEKARKAEYAQVNAKLAETPERYVGLLAKFEHISLYDQLKSSFINHYTTQRKIINAGNNSTPEEKQAAFSALSLYNINVHNKTAKDPLSNDVDICARFRAFILWVARCTLDARAQTTTVNNAAHIINIDDLDAELSELVTKQPPATIPAHHYGASDRLIKLVLGNEGLALNDFAPFDQYDWDGVQGTDGNPVAGAARALPLHPAPPGHAPDPYSGLLAPELLTGGFGQFLAGVGAAINESRRHIIGRAVSHGDGLGKCDVNLF